MKIPLKNMECILVNDGSTDRTVDICEQYLKEDSRFKLFTTNNGGVSTARNIGVKNANGEYLFFLDADDYLYEARYDKLIRALELDYDFYAFSYFTLYEDNSICEESFGIDSNYNTDLNTVYYLLLASAKLNTCWGKLLKRNIIIQNSIKFPVDMKTGEDAVFIINYTKYIKTCCIENCGIQYYR
jgi:glycosyltransferase involved in cell wall biosynthesis